MRLIAITALLAGVVLPAPARACTSIMARCCSSISSIRVCSRSLGRDSTAINCVTMFSMSNPDIRPTPVLMVPIV